jgi:hypothetical protein
LREQEEIKKGTLCLLEEVVQIALNNNNSGNKISVEQMRERILKLKNQWKQLENEIEVI